jgi:hypothetical protein
MAFKENKCKYADKEEEEVVEESMATSKKRWASGDDNDTMTVTPLLHPMMFHRRGGLFRGETHPASPLRRR